MLLGWNEWKEKGGKCPRCGHERADHNDFNIACTKCGCGWFG